MSQTGPAWDTTKLMPWEQIAQLDPIHQRPLTVLASCGSYNPVHSAHIDMIHTAKEQLESQAAFHPSMTATFPPAPLVIGAFISPVNDYYKKDGLLSFEHRVAICKAVLQTSPLIAVDEWEGQQGEYQRTYVVLAQLLAKIRVFYDSTARNKEEKERAQHLQLTFVCGADLFETFYRPGVWTLSLLKKIFEEFGLAVVCRSGNKNPRDVVSSHTCPLTSEKEPGVSLDLTPYATRVAVVTIPPNTTSSTLIRQRLKDKGSLEGLLPPAAAAYILAHNLYA